MEFLKVIGIIFLIFFALFTIATLIIVASCCRLSGNISREEEERWIREKMEGVK